jgi:pimeloyl-ACP methyl ester carboxylesterase
MQSVDTQVARAFRVDVDDALVQRIRMRLSDAHWTPCPIDDQDWRYGTDAHWLRDFVDHWTTSYDWGAAQDRLNQWPQFLSSVGGQDVHFYHVKGSSSQSRAIVLTHGWPGSVLEFLDCIDRLAFPGRYGGDPELGFDVVIPSLPGYGFSERPESPIGPREVALRWRKLMVDVLGYADFFAQGGDWGAAVTSWLGIDHADVTRAIHLNMIPSWIFAPSAAPDDQESAYHDQVAAMRASEMGYFMVQSTKPQTLALALCDSPLGFAAWVCEKFRSWGDTRGDIDRRFSRDELITNLMIYLLTDTVGSALWMYKGRAQECPTGTVPPRVDVPTGVACYPAEIIPYPPRHVAERAYAIASWHMMPAGGHFAAMEEPQAFSHEVAGFFNGLGI